jgi:hypothetical protein
MGSQPWLCVARDKLAPKRRKNRWEHGKVFWEADGLGNPREYEGIQDNQSAV